MDFSSLVYLFLLIFFGGIISVALGVNPHYIVWGVVITVLFALFVALAYKVLI